MKFAAKLLLENGISFEGIGFGFQKIGVGEVVFNTAITGYQEIFVIFQVTTVQKCLWRIF